MFFVKSEEEIALCPNCGELLVYQCRVIRSLKNKTGVKSKYNIRVLKCKNKNCPATYHRELPDIIIPYKRYDTESIEEAISHGNAEISVAADDSTIRRWRKWFERNAVNIIMSLISVPVVFGNNLCSIANSSSLEIQDIQNPIETIKKTVVRTAKWLNETVRILVNSSKWRFNRSAFLTG